MKYRDELQDLAEVIQLYERIECMKQRIPFDSFPQFQTQFNLVLEFFSSQFSSLSSTMMFSGSSQSGQRGGEGERTERGIQLNDVDTLEEAVPMLTPEQSTDSLS